jgi:hypothetical protein
MNEISGDDRKKKKKATYQVQHDLTKKHILESKHSLGIILTGISFKCLIEI